MGGKVQSVRSASLTLWPHPGVGSPQRPAATVYGSYQFPGSLGFSMTIADGRRYTEWVNMSYPNGTAPGGLWVPLWDEVRAQEYYVDTAESINAAVNPSKSTIVEMESS